MAADIDMDSNDLLNVNSVGTQALTIAGTSIVAGSTLSVPDATNVPFTQTGTGATLANVAEKLKEYINVVVDFGAVGDGTTDDTTAFQNAIIEAKASNKAIFVPYGKYLITSLLDCFRVSIIGELASDEAELSQDSPWPVLIYDATLSDTGMCRVGQATASTELTDRTTFANFMIDMTSAPNNARGVFCEHGVNEKTIKNVYCRGTSDTIANLVTENISGIDLRLSDTATQGLYYLHLDNLVGFYMFRGFYTSGNSNDGMRVSNIGTIRSWNCVQGITFKDSSSNNIDILGVQGFLAGYDPSGTTPSEWGVYMDYKWNTVGNTYFEGSGTTTNPVMFVTENHSINFRDLENVPNMVQVIDSDGSRQVGSEAGTSLGVSTFANHLEAGSIGGPQTQESLLVNSNFALWTGGSSNISDAASFAHSWVARKDEATATLGILQRTGSSNTLTYNNAVRIEVTNPVANNLYGFGQDVASYMPLSGSVLQTLSKNFEYVTVAVVCRPYSSNAAPIRCRIESDLGTSTTGENYLISYNQTTDEATNDQPVFGDDGKWFTLIHHVNLTTSMTKFNVEFGYYPADTVDGSIHVDGVYLINGRHTQYGARPYVKTPELIQAPNAAANTNTPSGATANAVEIFDKDGASLGFVPVYAAQW